MARAAPYDRESTLQAAMALFWDKGYHATSLKDLEAALVMKPGSIYAAFKSKENLYLLAMERYFKTFRGQFRDRIASANTPLQGLADHLRAFATLPADDAARQACMLIKTFVDTRTTEAAIAEQSHTYLGIMRAEIAAAFGAAQAEGQIPADLDSDRLAHRYQAYVNALRLEIHMRTGQTELVELADTFASEIESLAQ